MSWLTEKTLNLNLRRDSPGHMIEQSSQEPLYLGFFHTGAYQDAISGYGGIKHCLIPSPRYVLVDRNEKGDYVDTLYRDEQRAEDMLKILGY